MRCAIYTRRSADERANTQLGSTERQRELCEAYVSSQAGEGWQVLPACYDDPGYSGGTLRRPALLRLLADVEAGQVDTILVYKIDRLSRSLRDFLELVRQFERHGTRFVAITQHFDTVSSTGRLMLNILLSFAQFERELTSERLKDWFAGARARGLWNGPAPYGYTVTRGVMAVHPEQANIVRYIFQRYPVIRSGKELARVINKRGALNQWGRPFDGWGIYRILRSRLYLGELPHRGDYLPGVHEALITERIWRKASEAVAQSVRAKRARNPPRDAPLRGLLHDRNGAPMIHMLYQRSKRRYHYYVPSRQRYGPGTSPADRYRAEELENAVIAALERVGCPIQSGNRPGELCGSVLRLVDRIDLGESLMRISLHTGGILEAPVAGRVDSRAINP